MLSHSLRFAALATTLACLACSSDEPVTSRRGNDGGAPVGDLCAGDCRSDDECNENGALVDGRCSEGACVDVGVDGGCLADIDCLVLTTPCRRSDDCAEGEVCVEPGGELSRCALPADSGVECVEFGSEARELPVRGGGTAMVCIDPSRVCDEGTCRAACEADDVCTAPGAPVCDVATGRCGCGSDEDCTGDGERCVDGRCSC